MKTKDAIRIIQNGLESLDDCYEALKDILEIGKRDLSNPKYDGYFKTAKQAIKKARLIAASAQNKKIIA